MKHLLVCAALFVGFANFTGCSSSSSTPNNAPVDPQTSLSPLTPPAAGTGFQLRLQPFPIQADSEREVFYYQANPAQDTQYIKTIDVKMRIGSHHFVLWNIKGADDGIADGALRERSETEMGRMDRSFLFGAQTQEAHYTFPEGVALALAPNEGFDINSHYVNATTNTIHGEAYINLLTVPKSAVKHYAHPFLSADISFNIPANSTTTQKVWWDPITDTTHLIMLTSHAHKHLKSFKIYKNGPDGKLLYTSLDWHDPITTQMDEVFYPGENLYSETTWTNTTSKPLKFGYTSNDEMNIILGYFWK